ncbi:hypothetical protein MMC34_007646 [Xylographa carneopallida]|nr:hypothetical protein [Xylographa carneopallida]
MDSEVQDHVNLDYRTRNAAILYQNEEKTVTLIDIPLSISLAQVLPGQCCDRILLSTPALEKPYPSTEPKSCAARAKVLSQIGPTEDAYDYADFIRKGLQEIRDSHKTSWCLPRKVRSVAPSPRKKRRIKDVDASIDHAMPVQEPHLSVLELSSQIIEACPTTCTCIISVERSMITIQNATSRPAKMFMPKTSAIFHIPPHSTMILSNIGVRTAWAFKYEALRLYQMSSASADPGQFDFVLLDPPWQNRSVARSKSYKTIRDEDPIQLLREDLGQHIACNGLVGCWVTNKPDVRKVAENCFEAWNLDLVEEWVWIKTTASGEPVYEVEGLWRKPYEILLLGRKAMPIELSAPGDGNIAKSLSRRLIAGVPDLHSRKPCLKDLIEPMIHNPRDYRAIEIFARNMTTGWLAYGDESLKFNWDGHWTDFLSKQFEPFEVAPE